MQWLPACHAGDHAKPMGEEHCVRTLGAASIGLIPWKHSYLAKAFGKITNMMLDCYLATRRKAQTIRHNIDEMRKLPNLICAHTHDAAWMASLFVPAMVLYTIPSREESEYTASLVFTIAVSCSFLGYTTRVCQTSYITIACPWSAQVIDHLGCSFQPIHFEHVQWSAQPSKSDCYLLRHASKDAPQRVHVQDVLLADHTLPSDVTYV